jgi:hypothetical protein
VHVVMTADAQHSVLWLIFKMFYDHYQVSIKHSKNVPNRRTCLSFGFMLWRPMHKHSQYQRLKISIYSHKYFKSLSEASVFALTVSADG